MLFALAVFNGQGFFLHLIQMNLRSFLFKIGLLGAVSLVLSCASRSSFVSDQYPVYYSDLHFVHLIDPAKNPTKIEERQNMTGAYGDKKFSAESWMLLDSASMRIMLFSSMGNTLAEISYTQDSITFESRWMDAKKIKPEYILADIQFCYYPTNVLKENFERADLEFSEVELSDRKVRTLSESGREILRMEKIGNRISLKNELRKYSYQVESLP